MTHEFKSADFHARQNFFRKNGHVTQGKVQLQHVPASGPCTMSTSVRPHLNGTCMMNRGGFLSGWGAGFGGWPPPICRRIKITKIRKLKTIANIMAEI